jgi:hypothetical protein
MFKKIRKTQKILDFDNNDDDEQHSGTEHASRDIISTVKPKENEMVAKHTLLGI